MSRRWFSADFHLGMASIIPLENRPFESVQEMNDTLIGSCVDQAAEGDVIIHLGDLASYGQDQHAVSLGLDASGSEVKPARMLSGIKAAFLNIRGNHDLSNDVKSLANSMQICLGKRYPQVVCGHYPTYDERSKYYRRNGWITLCGHVHGKWRHCLDLDRQCLNINVGVDAWNYRIISEDELVRYVNRLISHRPAELYRCRTIGKKVVFYGDSNL